MTIIDEIIEALESRVFKIRWIKRTDVDGLCNYREKTIYISVFAPNKESTLIHEVIHWLYPRWSESLVLLYEMICYENLTAEDMRTLKRFLRNSKLRYLKEKHRKKESEDN
jgi:hypothetical protein